MSDECAATLLAPTGPIAANLPGFEVRHEQLDMAQRIEAAMAQGERLLVEAGTGIGKSFAYLVPAIQRAVKHHERIVIATHTISLQEQLIEKDIPLLRQSLATKFKAVLVKGRGNYLSLRRLRLASERQEVLFPDVEQLKALHLIEDWAYATQDGSQSSLPQLTRPEIWDRVQSDADNCMGRRCPSYDKCFFQSARREMEGADLLICNHALFFSDLALRAQGVGFLPEYHHVILDEAHNVEDVASQHFGLSLTEGRVRHLLNVLLTNRRPSRGAPKARGFLATLDATATAVTAAVDQAIRCVLASRRHAALFFDALTELGEGQSEPSAIRIFSPGAIVNHLTQPMRDLALRLKTLKAQVQSDADVFELNAYAERAAAIAREAEALVDQSIQGCVYWVEITQRRGGSRRRASRRVRLACSPIEIAPMLRRYLFSRAGSVILTSATLTTGPDDFSHLISRLGCRPDEESVDEGEGNDSALVVVAATSSQSPDEFCADDVHEPIVDSKDADAPFMDEDGVVEARVDLNSSETTIGQPAVLQLGSPFDYATQVEFFVETAIPDPNDPAYIDRLSPRIVHHVRATDGGAFVLFTSFSMLHRTADLIRAPLAELHLPLLVHGEDGPRRLLLERFKADERSVLLGTVSFWQGVDVRGRGLRNVIITRLPFDVPDRPLIQARLERIRERGGNPFIADSLPRAVIRFRQGFGRLIRSTTDRGRFVVLDPRLISKWYGKRFRNALPRGLTNPQLEADVRNH